MLVRVTPLADVDIIGAHLCLFAKVRLFVGLFVCLFVCWNKTRKTSLRLLCWEGSKPPGSDHTRTEARFKAIHMRKPAKKMMEIESCGG